MPDDHYNVFKNITRFSYIEQEDIFDLCKDNIWVTDKNHHLHQRYIGNIRDLKRKNAIAFCETSDFRSHIRSNNKVKSNKTEMNQGVITKRTRGIPQGSPISSILANVYLLDFDRNINHAVSRKGGYYRRYSDDIIVVCPYEYRQEIMQLILFSITKYKLSIQQSKTNSFIFDINELGKLECSKIFNRRDSNNKRLEYLGFEFDGEYSYIKSASISKFYRNMKRAISRGEFYALHSSYAEGRGRIFRKRLYRRFSFLGAKRKIKWERSIDSKKWTKSTKHNWGNFLTYAYMAQNNMKKNKIKSQVSHHWEKLNSMILCKEKDIKNSLYLK